LAKLRSYYFMDDHEDNHNTAEKLDAVEKLILTYIRPINKDIVVTNNNSDIF